MSLENLITYLKFVRFRSRSDDESGTLASPPGESYHLRVQPATRPLTGSHVITVGTVQK